MLSFHYEDLSLRYCNIFSNSWHGSPVSWGLDMRGESSHLTLGAHLRMRQSAHLSTVCKR